MKAEWAYSYSKGNYLETSPIIDTEERQKADSCIGSVIPPFIPTGSAILLSE